MMLTEKSTFTWDGPGGIRRVGASAEAAARKAGVQVTAPRTFVMSAKSAGPKSKATVAAISPANGKQHSSDELARAKSSASASAKAAERQRRATFADRRWRGECKRRKELPAWLVTALDGCDFVALRADRHEAVALIPLRTLMELMQ